MGMKHPIPTFPNSVPAPTRVLVAEDNEKTRTALVFLLERHGYDVSVVTDGQAALNVLLGPNPPHIALLDWEMPRLDGIHVCLGVRTMPTRHYTYIVMLTAHDQVSDMLAAFAAGVDDFLSKPVDSAQLLARLRCGERVLTLEKRSEERIAELARAHDEVRQLKHLVPLCMHCKKVCDGSGCWREMEAYVQENSRTDFFNGACPECIGSGVPLPLLSPPEALPNA